MYAEDIFLPDPVPTGDPSLLGINRKLTRSFILANPVSITLIPRSKEQKPAGGWAWVEGAPRLEQTMTLVEPSSPSAPKPMVTLNGVERSVDFILIGEWDSSMSPGDTFEHQDKEWEVVEMFYSNGYEKRALVSARSTP